jgi:protein SCO1/2
LRHITRVWWLLLTLTGLHGCSADDTWHAKDISRLMPGLEFELTDETNRRVEASQYRGQVVMLFFGYTHCPDYCPTTLSKLRQLLDRLDGRRDQVRVLFVSVDPRRDSPGDLAVYTANFAPEVIGLTGEEPALRRLAKRYRTTFSYDEPDKYGNYNVSHGLAVYVFDRTGRARLMILGSESVEDIAQDMTRLLAE